MVQTSTDKVFTGSIPRIYETHLVPLIFEAYATDLVRRLVPRRPVHVLEIAAGTGVVTRAMAEALPSAVEIIATDLNQAMLDAAAAMGTCRPVVWQQADAQALPFPPARFDAVVCQYGVMFFPDKPAAFAEVSRVLRPGGIFLFNAWDRLETNEIACTVHAALGEFFPEDPPGFLARTPYGYHDPARIRADLSASGLSEPEIETVTACSRCPSPQAAALGYCQGTPLRGEIEARGGPGRLEEATTAAAAALAYRFGPGPVEAAMQALVVTTGKPDAGPAAGRRG